MGLKNWRYTLFAKVYTAKFKESDPFLKAGNGNTAQQGAGIC